MRTLPDCAAAVPGVAGVPRFKVTWVVPSGADVATGTLIGLLEAPNGALLVGDGAGTRPLTAVVERSALGKVIGAPGFTALTLRQVNARSAELARAYVPLSATQWLRPVGMSEADVIPASAAASC